MINFILGVVAALIGTLIVREIADYLPFIGRWLVKRSVRRLPESQQTKIHEQLLIVANKLPGGGLTKVVWGFACKWIAPLYQEPSNPKTIARIVRGVLFYAYLRATARDFVRLRFASPKQLRLRWQLLQMLGAPNDPNPPQPLLELAQKLQKFEEMKRGSSAPGAS